MNTVETTSVNPHSSNAVLAAVRSNIEDKNHTWIVGDVFITRFWGVAEVCLIRNISDKYIRFNRLEAIRDLKGIKKDYCGAEMEIELFLKINKTFLHHSEWHYEYKDVV